MNGHPHPAFERLRDRVRDAVTRHTPLRIRGGGTKDFYGNRPTGELFDPREYAGIVDHAPTELVVTVRSGTSLAELETALAEHRQILPFEPPHFGPGATVGGAVAAGLAGPRRVAAGSVRDFVLGASMIDGRGELLSFGGRVMKNVAGYDMARVLAGSLGTLGVLVDVSLKVLPRPVAELTLAFDIDEAAAIRQLNEWGGQPLPISASAWCKGELHIRLSGARAAVDAARARLGGRAIDGADAWWSDLREQRHSFFAGSGPLWRLAVPPTTPPLELGATLIEWHGGQRWIRADHAAAALHTVAGDVGGHATRFRGGDANVNAFQPLEPALARIHARLKAEFDPAGIFNPGRLVPH
ncbi:MAG TPA: glycolate oxidase subunit GlcE [Burkholderiaceae bacterium]|nr:glycolate oxidase subunit GlcE [Burkholderiaceae bacterium]